jgi:hypothetical protein
VGLSDPRDYLSTLAEQSRAVPPVAGPPRLRGVEGRAEPDLAALRKEIEAAAVAAHFDGLLEHGVDQAVEMTSLLYAAGADAPLWRHWSVLAGRGYLLLGRPATAYAYLVLGGDRSPAAGTDDHVLARIATGSAEVDGLPDDDDVDTAWRELVRAIPAGQWPRVDAALTEIAAFWMGEAEDEGWDVYHPHEAPVFEPEPCAAAALAVRAGYRPDGLDEETARFLRPGLMPGFPEPLAG